MRKFFDKLTNRICQGKDITFDEAYRLLEIKEQKDIVFLLSYANCIREKFKGSKIDLCAIVNAKSGRCSEDCTFCAQSAHYNTDINRYELLKVEEIVKKANYAHELGINRFSIVISGRDVKNTSEWDSICKSITKISSISGLKTCASLGTLTREAACDLTKAGLDRYHHNLETAESFFPNICTTHSYKDRVDTVKAAQDEGLNVCCGGLFGIGENSKQRLELAFALKDLDVDSIPLNFLNPIPHTPLQNEPPIPPMEILKIIAVFRFINPKKGIRICGGRQINLRKLQALIFLAGADAVMTGDYLTTSGSETNIDIEMIEDLMLTAS